MKGIAKASITDKYLQPIRYQIVELVEPNCTVVEFACANGDLLFKLSGKIKSGIGIDISEQLIAYAKHRTEQEQLHHLEFRKSDLLNGKEFKKNTDYFIASLLFHLLPWEQSRQLLINQVNSTKTAIICGFSKPNTFWQKTALWFDQRFTGHYVHFHQYANNGYMEGLLNSIPNIEYQRMDTFDPVIKIYKINKAI